MKMTDQVKTRSAWQDFEHFTNVQIYSEKKSVILFFLYSYFMFESEVLCLHF